MKTKKKCVNYYLNVSNLTLLTYIISSLLTLSMNRLGISPDIPMS